MNDECVDPVSVSVSRIFLNFQKKVYIHYHLCIYYEFIYILVKECVSIDWMSSS
jgi:hypothetical protein